MTGKRDLRRRNGNGQIDALHEYAASFAQAARSRQFPRRIERFDGACIEIGEPKTFLARYSYNDSFRHGMPLSYC